MKFGRSRVAIRTGITLAVLIVALSMPSVPLAQQCEDSLIYPAGSQPFGMTYGDWQVAIWQYEFSIPVSTNPLLDSTGIDCNVAQSGGPVFFLNSAFFGAPVTRTCTVPAGKALLVPIAAWECSSVEPAPSYGANPQDMRTCAGTFMDGFGVQTLKLTVDGRKVPEVQKMRVQTPYFQFTMPATDNLLGLDGVTSGSSVSDAYLVMLKPLAPGNHVIEFEGAFVTGPAAGASFGVTYHLTVQ